MARMTPRKVALATSFTALKPHQSGRSGGAALLSEGLQIRPSSHSGLWWWNDVILLILPISAVTKLDLHIWFPRPYGSIALWHQNSATATSVRLIALHFPAWAVLPVVACFVLLPTMLLCKLVGRAAMRHSAEGR